MVRPMSKAQDDAMAFASSGKLKPIGWSVILFQMPGLLVGIVIGCLLATLL